MAEIESSPPEPDLSVWNLRASDGAEFLLRSVEDVRQFIERENSRWSWVRSSNNAHVNNALKDVLNFKPHLVSVNSQSPPFEMRKGSIVRDMLQRYLDFKPALHGRAPLQGFVFALYEKDPSQAIAALGWILKDAAMLKDFGTDLVPGGWIAGVTEAILWKRGLAPDSDASALTQRLTRAAEDGERSFERSSNAALSMDRIAQSMSDKVTGSAAAADSILANTSKATDDLLRDLKAEWARLTKTYDDKLALSAPSQYWNSKAKLHRWRSIQFAVSASVVGVCGAWAFWSLVQFIFGDHLMNQLPKWSQVLPTAIFGVLYLWVLKTLLRLTMSHVHLGLDAAERRVMIMSYLALSRRREVTKDELSVLFAAIFRPSGDGIVKDETPPLAMLEMLRGGRP